MGDLEEANRSWVQIILGSALVIMMAIVAYFNSSLVNLTVEVARFSGELKHITEKIDSLEEAKHRHKPEA